MNNNYAETYRRNQTLKNVFIGVLVIAVIVLAVLLLARGCEDNSSTTPSVDTTYEQLIEEQVKNDLLQAELDALKAEKASVEEELANLKCSASADAKEVASLKSQLAQANNTAKAWKDKYESHKCPTSSGSSVDLSGYVAKSTYDAKVKAMDDLQAKYNTLEATHKSCSSGSTVDMSKYVSKSTYDAKVKELTDLQGKHKDCDTWESKYNELLKLYNEFVAAHKSCSTNVSADHSQCVLKSEYDKLNNRLTDTQNELAVLRNAHANCNNHNSCVAKTTYDAVVQAKVDLEAKYNTLLSEYNSFKAQHTNCGGSGTTTVYADHSNCVSLTDYKELLAKYNALLGY